MLSKILLYLPFLKLTLANNDMMEAELMALKKDLKKQLMKQQGRTFDSIWAQNIISSIDGYGCWCYFQEEHGSGRGSPVNKVDELCKILQDGYSCILMDADDEGEGGCVPWDVKYNSATGLGLLASDNDNNSSLEDALRFKCKLKNKKSNCAARACMVENYFVVSLVKLFLSGDRFNDSLLHSKKKFDPIEGCPVKTRIGDPVTKECCGLYPVRFPYRHRNGDRSCCVDKTYRTDLMVCCADGSVKLAC